MNDRMTHLHVHTDASMRDGLGTVPRLISHAKSLGFKQIAMTDHGTLANAVTFSIEATRAGLKPLLGLEGYVEFDGTIGHITLLADGSVGWNSLLKLNNLAHAGSYRNPAFTIDQLTANSTGLVCLTGCIASPFHQLSYNDAYSLGLRLKKSFGHRLFAELMFVSEGLNWERPMRLASRLGIKGVITNDVHFPERSDRTVHPILTQMKSGFEYDSRQLYLKTYDQMLYAATRADFSAVEAKEMLLRTGKIADKLGFVDLHSEPKLPTIDRTVGALTRLIYERERASVITASTVYFDRLDHELRTIRDMGFTDYFLILDDILTNAKAAGVKVGPGRGSGAGSLVLYLLGITDVDPIKYGLQFERFLNPERRGMPDVDVDIDSERRDFVLDYASEKYGAVPIATYSRYSHKSLTRDLCKMFKVKKGMTDLAAENGPNSDEFAEVVREAGPKFLNAYESFLGQMRHKGKHAGGVIITDTPVPIERIGDTLGAAWTEGKSNELSYAGIVKFDLLGLSALSALRRLEEEMDEVAPQPVDFAPAFQIFRDGDLAGVFQFAGSEGIRKLTMELAPTTFEELIAINALYRPGAIDAGSTAKYPEWKKKPREVALYIADILEETYGAIVYQEQVMAIFQRTVDGTLAEADLARRVITKSKPDDPTWVEKFDQLKADFVSGAMFSHGMTSTGAFALWKELATHSNYSFNKAHSTAYAMISWQCAWWKLNYPAQFYAAMLNVDPQQEQTYIIEAVKAEIKVSHPHVNESSNEWEAKGMEIFMPLSAIKFLGKAGVDSLIREREATEGGTFATVEHFMEIVPKRAVNARARKGLMMLGGFRGLMDGMGDIDKLAERLEVKDFKPVGSRSERQLTYLGFIVPDKKLLTMFGHYELKGWAVGIINSKDKRVSKWGPYTVYRLSPNGVFWTRDADDLRKGQAVAANVSSKNGKAKTIKIL